MPGELVRGVGAAIRGQTLLHWGLDPSTEPTFTVVPRRMRSQSPSENLGKCGRDLVQCWAPINQPFESDDGRFSWNMLSFFQLSRVEALKAMVTANQNLISGTQHLPHLPLTKGKMSDLESERLLEPSINAQKSLVTLLQCHPPAKDQQQWEDNST